MKKIFIFLFLFTIVHSFPCPPECICKPTDINDVDSIRISYLIDCTNISLNNEKLIYQAEQWSINEEKIGNDDPDDDASFDYLISIDLSNSLSLKKFTNTTIELTDFSYSLQSLSLTNQPKNFMLTLNSFYSSIYDNLKQLNLSSCCQQIPKNCGEIFRPLNKLERLDLSGSNMYKTCLDTPDTISSTLRDLILRNNIYSMSVFSKSNSLFDGVQRISGTLDLQNSRFQLDNQMTGVCIFDVFERISSLDLSSIKFDNNINDTEVYLTQLLGCENQSEDNQNTEGLLSIYLRQLNLKYLPKWFTNERFPSLKLLDLSNNNFYSIDISKYLKLNQISLAYNPIDLKNIVWRAENVYQSINLRSTTRNQTIDLANRLKLVFKLTNNIDYSENKGKTPTNLITIPIEIDSEPNKVYLNISGTNIYSFQVNYKDVYQLDISSNSLNELNLNDQIKLNYLDCSNQYLKKLILNKQLEQLKELKCSNNSLITIENFSLLKNEELRSIDLSFNLINSLKDLFENLNSRYLRQINLKSNQIQIIPSGIFHDRLISLYEINLSSNKIHTIEKNAFQALNLQILDLSDNPLINIASDSILTASLRIIYVFNNTQQSTNRCKQFKINYNLLSKKFKPDEQNGTLMKTEYNKCLISDIEQQTKTQLFIKKGKDIIRFYTLYVILGITGIAIFFGGVHYYRKSGGLPFRRYKKLNRHMLVENEAEMDQREEDEIVMNLEEPPYNKHTGGPTNV